MAKDKPSLRDRLRAHVVANTRVGGKPCATCKLPKDILDAVRDEKNAGAQLRALASAIALEGYVIGHSTLARHFREHEQR